MRGHEPLIAMRLRRKKPSSSISVSIWPGRSWIADHWHEWEGTAPFVSIDPSESIEGLDLRFLVGLKVIVDGDEAFASHVWRLFDACTKAGADRVLGGTHREVRAGELETVKHRDSQGVIEWHI